MIYLFTKADGKQTEGIGAVAQCQIHTYTLSKMLGVGFASTKFENLQHYQEYDTQENFSNDVTNFFNFPNQIEPPSDAIKFEHVDQTFAGPININICSNICRSGLAGRRSPGRPRGYNLPAPEAPSRA